MWFVHLTLLLFIYTFGPGMLLLRPFKLAPRERLVVAVGVGLFLNYLLGFGIFALGLPPASHLLVTGVCVLLGILAWKDWLLLLRLKSVRRLLLCWLLIAVWGVVLLSMIRNYGGGTWGGDWVEHYQRSVFFVGDAPMDFKFIGQYPLPMRPPMMNVLTVSLLAQAAPTPDISPQAFQLIFVFLNSLIFLPLAIVVPRLVRLTPRLARKVPWTLAALLAASPMFDQNLTYAWTKLFAGFYAIAAIAIYLRAWRRGRGANAALTPSPGTPGEGRGRGSSSRAASIENNGPAGVLPYRPEEADRAARPARPYEFNGFVLAFALMCVGFLVHFSVGPYGLFLGLHYLLAVWWRRPNKLVEAATIGGVSALVLASWFAWSVANYGAGTTFTSTSAVSDSVKMTGEENVANIAKNFANTLLPTIVRSPDQLWSEDLEQPGLAGRARDYAFLVYQVSVPGGLGSVGFVLTLYLLWRALAGRDPSARPVRWFWLGFVVVVYVAGVAVYGGVDRFGVAHICLQPMIFLGIALVAGGIWRLNVRWKGVLLLGLLLDFGVGVMLHMTLQNRLPEVDVITARGPAGETLVLGYQFLATPETPSRAAQNNYKNKLEMDMTFWGDNFGDEALPVLQFAAGGMLAFFLFKGLAAPDRRRVTVLREERAAEARQAKAGRSRKSRSRRA